MKKLAILAVLMFVLVCFTGAYAQAAKTQCNDKRDNDADGKIDLKDPGCSSKLDNDETDPITPPPPPPAQCQDGLDNDADGLTDYPSDPGCSSTSDTDETDSVTPPPDTSCGKWASPSGSDTNSGTQSSPYRSVEKLANSLTAGQTGCLASGTYTEPDNTVSITPAGTSSSRITLQADPNATSKPLVNARLSVGATADYWTIKGIEWDGSYSPACGSGSTCTILPGFTWNGDSGQIIGNDIHSRRAGSEATLAGICINAGTSGNIISGLEIANNNIHHCGRIPLSNHDHGVYLDHTRGASVHDNFIYENADRGIQLYTDADGSDIYNNVVDRNGEGIIFSGSTSNTSTDNNVHNNVFSNSKARWLAEDFWDGAVGTGNVFHNNCVWPSNANSNYNQNGGVEPGASGFSASNNLQTQPLYIDPANGNYNQSSASGCAGYKSF